MEKLRISENGRYFLNPDGTVFSWLADTAWTMPQRLKWDDVDYFMKKRKSQGYSVLQIVALDPEQDPEMRNPAGEKALLNDDIETPNERYFAYLDWIIDKAEEYGFYVLLLPAWGQLIVGHNWMGEFSTKIVTEENARQYGQWIGSRYKDKKHILWCLGGDRQPIHLGVDYKNVWRLMAEGIAKGVTGKDLKYDQPDPLWKELLITYHTCHEMETGECSTMSYWDDNEAWISFIMLQSGHGLTPKNYELVKKEYDRERTLPVWDGEPAYEMMPTSWPDFKDFHGPWMVRKRAYWSLFAGAFGFTYGHCSVWCSISEKEKNAMNKLSWYDALHSEGAGQMKYLRELMDALQIASFRPRQDILPEIVGEDVLDLHVQACGSKNQEYFCVYFPSGGETTLNLKDFQQERAYFWWYNPRDGKFYSEQEHVTDQAEEKLLENGIVSVKAPAYGPEQDWVLVAMKEKTQVPIKEKQYLDFEEQAEAKKVFEW